MAIASSALVSACVTLIPISCLQAHWSEATGKSATFSFIQPTNGSLKRMNSEVAESKTDLRLKMLKK